MICQLPRVHAALNHLVHVGNGALHDLGLELTHVHPQAQRGQRGFHFMCQHGKELALIFAVSFFAFRLLLAAFQGQANQHFFFS